ncbi:WLM-domain-containing protein [Macroventuria anomochaeta]|uniref:WLM-domain-containing protein n=1 Tax=Macroventuria anomochaeta TaxID=301207 RepID=A0ACB6S8I3_9PLEO|nr:WLM-domain-containing protein [Macroventuria anomochaeta]KAF2629890.1 WLM-domain-containing protein [Macroventuria anomochaeta]
MPLGFERINERTQRPNTLINFIRTIHGPSSTTAEQILNRVAAVCYPFMKANMILVQALEEFPYNTEFVGRNFNAGEVIQLVLRDRNGRWLPQRMVEMVMVHELAHCKQMNHSKAFWKVRDAYAVDLRALWAKGYTGEGMWGRGRGLETMNIQTSQVDVGDVPEHLCDGTYGRRSKKRRRGGKEKETLSYAERKQRRILKKFGAGGQSLGADDDTKVKLQGGVPKKGKPRVAGSARGRELRAAAALARFEPVKKEQEEVTIKKEETSDSETEDEYENVDQADAALDVDGSKLVDDKGRALIKICEDEDDKDGNARREMDEIQGIALQSKPFLDKSASTPLLRSDTARQSSKPSKPLPKTTSSSSAQVIHLDEIWKRRPEASASPATAKPTTRPAAVRVSCNVCSLSNEPRSLTCAVCSNVLSPYLVSDHWRCTREPCKQSIYINAGDAGACGVCAKPRLAQ